MGGIRALALEDLPAVADLRRRTFRFSRWDSAEALQAYLKTVFLENPWYDEELPSLVYEESPGKIAGFLGVVPRPMVMHGKAIRAAVTTQFMVAPESRGLVGIELVRRAFAGPQDLLIADVPNSAARSLWEGLGGQSARLYGLSWILRIRPLRYAASQLGAGMLVRGVRFLSRPLLNISDAVAARRSQSSLRKSSVGAVGEPLAVETMAAELAALVGNRGLRPHYDPVALRWLLDRVAQKWPDEALEKVLVRSSNGQIAGWFLYLRNSGGISQVLQVVARPGRHREVLEHLSHSALCNSALALRGRFEQACMPELIKLRCSYAYDGRGVLVHSQKPNLTHEVLSGNAMLTGLDGEWWMDF